MEARIILHFVVDYKKACKENIGTYGDTQAVLAWVRDPQNAKKHRMDPDRIVLIVHGMGAFMAAAAGRDPKVMGVAMLAAWNIGAHARHVADPAKAKSRLSNLLALSGCTADGLYAEIQADGKKKISTEESV
jgi:acetyl esterase/lipase